MGAYKASTSVFKCIVANKQALVNRQGLKLDGHTSKKERNRKIYHTHGTLVIQ
jgi:hypothetical protein